METKDQNTLDGRHYHNVGGSYHLPNDSPEHDRLDAQSKSIVAMMGGKPFHAPVSSPKRIVDIGCGTGSMTYLLAKMYPEAQVIGLDISAVPDGLHGELPNLEYVQGDIRELLKDGTDPMFQKGSFDYVYERLLIFGMTDWPGYISDVTSLLKPGGWLEVHEPSTQVYRGDMRLADTWWFYPQWRSDFKARGLDNEVGARMHDLFKETGQLEETSDLVYKFHPVSIKDKPEMDGLGDAILPMLRGVIRKFETGIRSEEEVDKMEQDLEATWAKGFEDGDHYRFNAVIGRKKAN